MTRTWKLVALGGGKLSFRSVQSLSERACRFNNKPTQAAVYHVKYRLEANLHNNVDWLMQLHV